MNLFIFCSTHYQIVRINLTVPETHHASLFFFSPPKSFVNLFVTVSFKYDYGSERLFLLRRGMSPTVGLQIEHVPSLSSSYGEGST